MADAPNPPEAPRAEPGYLPMAAYPGSSIAPPPPVPTWTRSYEVPTARKVVSAGLQLAVEARGAIRGASIYIGLLALGAFGPAVLLLLIGIARLLGDPGIAETIATNPEMVFVDQPELAGPLLLIYALLIGGAILLVGISIDAQAIAISILGGRASDQPLRLWEAIVRARQVFWRLLGAGLLVGLASTIVTIVVSLPFIRPYDTNTGVTFIGSMIGALFVTPFAFASAGVVLGDVGPIEAIRRSVALFRARPRISLVVTLFTLVTSAIQSFAIGAGADAAVRVADLMHLNLEQGGIALVITAVIVLAFIVAFGSLTFTIAAIVAAPQVAGFLGLTYYSGGLDKARSAHGARPRRFRWVSLPMVVAMVGLLVLAGLGLPSVSGFQPRAASPLLLFLRPAAEAHGDAVSAIGGSELVDDPIGDPVGRTADAADIVAADYGYLPEVPAWLLSDLFDCHAPNVACPYALPDPDAYDEGALLFLQRMAGPPGGAAAGEHWEWGPVLALQDYTTAPVTPGDPFASASHAIVTRVSPLGRYVFYVAFDDGSFRGYQTNARSTWVGNDLITIVPLRSELQSDPEWWDVHASLFVDGATVSLDTLRTTSTLGGGMRPFGSAPLFLLVPSGISPTS